MRAPTEFRDFQQAPIESPVYDAGGEVTMYRRQLGPILACLVMFASACAAEDSSPAESAGRIFSEVPKKIDPDTRYLFYLHGAIIEQAGARPTHPKFGIYEYREILEVFARRGFVVISEARAAGTDVTEYAVIVADQVRALLESGVPAGYISVVGFSKGGGIAATVSSILDAEDVHFVLMAACGLWLNERPEIVPHGRVLSLREASDEMVGSCSGLFSRAGEGTVHQEIVIDIGGGHGAFYRPRPEWVDPVVEWALIAPS